MQHGYSVPCVKCTLVPIPVLGFMSFTMPWSEMSLATQMTLSRSPMSNIVFFDTHDILTIFQFDAIYRDIFTIFSKCKLGLNAPKFHSWSAYVEIFATQWRVCSNFRDKMARMFKFSRQNGAYVEIFATKWPIYGICFRRHHT